MKEDIKHLSNDLLFNPSFVKPCTINKLSESNLEVIKPYIAPSFCYDNAITSARLVNAENIVYGAVRVKLNNEWHSIEHCWIRLNGIDYDPTYEVILKEHQKSQIDYFSLFSVETNDFDTLTKQIGHALGAVAGLDFHWFRKAPKFEQYFIN
ncbi:hypothetical protein [Photobacterium leiognathi]|uniref:hypothetical protein n=1 Tax=Photobacterium leiognathi TaxID=553611 RepID=UPI0029820401|nr:hypothetical protein [Photobacterium leiognathi]